MIVPELTPPERFVENEQARVRRKVVDSLGGCMVCINRAGSAFGRGYCRDSARSYPTCRSSPGLQFQLDGPALNRAQEKVA